VDRAGQSRDLPRKKELYALHPQRLTNFRPAFENRRASGSPLAMPSSAAYSGSMPRAFRAIAENSGAPLRYESLPDQDRRREAASGFGFEPHRNWPYRSMPMRKDCSCWRGKGNGPPVGRDVASTRPAARTCDSPGFRAEFLARGATPDRSTCGSRSTFGGQEREEGEFARDDAAEPPEAGSDW